MTKKNKVLSGRFDSAEAVAEKIEKNKVVEGIEYKDDTFKITVKDDNDEVVYQNDKEPYQYPEADSLASILRFEGATLSDDKITFLSEALKSDDKKEDEAIGQSVKNVLEIVNAYYKQSASRNAYQRILNQHKPLTDENIMNAHASMVRNFMKTKNVNDETAIASLQKFEVIPTDYTVKEFRSNKGKR